MKTTGKQELYDRLIEVDVKSISKFFNSFQQIRKGEPIVGVLSTGKYNSYNLGFEIQLNSNVLQFNGGDSKVTLNDETVRLVELAFSKAKSLQGVELCTSKNNEGDWSISVRLTIDRFHKLSNENRKELLSKCVCALAYLGWCTELYDECGGSLDTISLCDYRIICTLTDTYEPYWGENISEDSLFDRFKLPYPDLSKISNDANQSFFI
ncbi:MAG: hypothetical protein QF718_09205 [Phycisphaerales bacterium]|nr:hypothetical protein [Phycisphaerales bacterium]